MYFSTKKYFKGCMSFVETYMVVFEVYILTGVPEFFLMV